VIKSKLTDCYHFQHQVGIQSVEIALMHTKWQVLRCSKGSVGDRTPHPLENKGSDRSSFSKRKVFT
jgi:hypothetical protein